MICLFNVLVFLLYISEGLCQTTVTCSECTCPPGTMDVTCRGYSVIPTFGGDITNRKILDMASNGITSLKDTAFQGMPLVTEIDLSNNSISIIDQHAFRNLNNLTKLNLRGNSITMFPNFADITGLEVLDISQNPINDNMFTESYLRHLGTTLKELHFGSKDHIRIWPSQTSHLQRLEILELNGAKLPFLNPSAFRGFEQRLKELTIRNADLRSTPQLSTLIHLQKLHLDKNPFGDYGILESSFQGLDNVIELSLNEDELTKFPYILHHLPKLQTLSLNGNKFNYISDSAVNIIQNSPIINLSLQNCSLYRIPGSISNSTLNKLQTLDFSFNNIVSVEKHDLNGLNSLRKLSLTGNPLQFISTEALNLANVYEINFSDTNIDSIPKTLLNMPSLRTVLIENNDIQCTCDLDWLAEYSLVRQGRLNIRGTCETVAYSIDYYIHNIIHQCIDYSSVTRYH